MRYLITKLFKTDADGDVIPTTAHLDGGSGGQQRQLTGCIGSPGSEGHHLTEVRTCGELTITVDHNATICIQPAE